MRVDEVTKQTTRYGRLSQCEDGATVAEFAIVAGIFFMLIIGIIEFGRLFYTHNALTDAARRGARYAVLNKTSGASCVKNVVVYGETHLNPNTCALPSGTQPLINGLATTHVSVVYDPTYGLNKGTATVSITGFNFNLGIPFLHRTLNMPSYASTLTAESAGTKPTNIPTP